MDYFNFYLTAFISLAAIIDLRTRRVPLWLTLPAMAGAVVYQLWMGGHIFGLIVAWAVAFLMWKLRIYGGGDAKVLMALFGYVPSLSLAWTLAVVSLIVAVPWLIVKYRHRLIAGAMTIGTMAISGNIFPATRSYKETGYPVVWIYAIGWLTWLACAQLF